MAAPTQASVKVVKSFTYRGAARTFSNRYFLNSTTGPADTAHWNTLFDAIVAAEKAIYGSGVTITECIGYEGGSELPIASKTYAVAGTGVFSNGKTLPGDCAAIVRYSTTQRTSKNHPIYLFNYYHSAQGTTAGAADDLNPAQKTAIETYATSWLSGFSDGTNTYIRSGPRGAVAQSRTVSPVVTHRDFRV